MNNNRPTGWVPSRKTASPARQVAYQVLYAVATDSAFANLLLPKIIKQQHLEAREARFATEITYGTLRWQGFADKVIELCYDQPKTRTLDLEIQIILRLGIYQLLCLRVPAHAAINETVSQARNIMGQGPAKLVNAVLHRCEEKSISTWQDIIKQQASSPIQGIADCYSTPLWQVNAIEEALANQNLSHTLSDYLATNLAPAEVTLAIKPGIIELSELQAEILSTKTEPGSYTKYSPWGLHCHGNPGKLASVRSHLVSVQDEGSQIVAGILAKTPIFDEDRLWLDMCAGPGGKAALLGAMAGASGAQLVANEVKEHRAALVDQALSAVEENYPQSTHIWCSDGCSIGEEYPNYFDRILVDAPCSGLGTLRRRPEARWHKTPQDIAQLRPLQKALLFSAIKAIRPGGVVVYATCSPHLTETKLVVEEAIQAHPEMIIENAVDIANRFCRVKIDNVQGPYLNLWPHLHNTDAMFAAVIRKQANE